MTGTETQLRCDVCKSTEGVLTIGADRFVTVVCHRCRKAGRRPTKGRKLQRLATVAGR